MRIKHFLNEFEKHINITSKDYEYCKMLYYNSATGKTRTVEQRKRISAATKKAMQNAVSSFFDTKKQLFKIKFNF